MQTENPAATVTAGATAGWGELFAGKNAIRSLTLVGGVALHAINVFIATTILPTVVADIGGMDYYAEHCAVRYSVYSWLSACPETSVSGRPTQCLPLQR